VWNRVVSDTVLIHENCQMMGRLLHALKRRSEGGWKRAMCRTVNSLSNRLQLDPSYRKFLYITA